MFRAYESFLMKEYVIKFEKKKIEKIDAKQIAKNDDPFDHEAISPFSFYCFHQPLFIYILPSSTLLRRYNFAR